LIQDTKTDEPATHELGIGTVALVTSH
jgi:hypothetical protein